MSDTPKETLPCLYCQTPNSQQQQTCSNCGMALAKAHPESKHRRQRLFVKVFCAIVVFCVVMMIYLPRGQ